MASLELLFNRGELRRLFGEKLAGMRSEIERTPDEHVLTAEADEWADALARRSAENDPTGTSLSTDASISRPRASPRRSMLSRSHGVKLCASFFQYSRGSSRSILPSYMPILLEAHVA